MDSSLSVAENGGLGGYLKTDHYTHCPSLKYSHFSITSMCKYERTILKRAAYVDQIVKQMICT